MADPPSADRITGGQRRSAKVDGSVGPSSHSKKGSDPFSLGAGRTCPCHAKEKGSDPFFEWLDGPTEPSTFALRRCPPVILSAEGGSAMTSRTLVTVIALVAPAAAFAQVSHSRAYITGPVVVPNEPAYVVPAQPYPSACTDLQDRRAMLDDEKVTYDRERDQLDAENAQLTQELRNLD